ncbi:class I SAM-dependent methyltransferase [Rhizobium sp. Root482]|uniref:class I SAM-dependent methyltransferase n=1 Tax=Rhizobium sp. Root482 TaxID=1736543 RepID=UPI0006F86E2C|nr:class I SAM-dependent methyltransferase [Rhizobium sp. Root482]KQY26728.1 hypothetical protein ASD31_00515 [Rhizobium sp. Root482]
MTISNAIVELISVDGQASYLDGTTSSADKRRENAAKQFDELLDAKIVELIKRHTADNSSASGQNAGASGMGVVAEISREQVRGWVIPTGDHDKVLIKVNGRVVAATAPAKRIKFEGGFQEYGFSRQIGDLFNFLGTDDRVEIEYNGNALPIVQCGMYYKRISKIVRKSRVEKLFEKIDQGFVFNKYGKLRLSLHKDEVFKVKLIELFDTVAAEVKAEFGYDLFPTYGTMLGAVRERNFIGHDNDFDSAYISKYSNPEDVRREFAQICGFLIDRGYSLRAQKTHTWVRVPGTSHKFDIFFSYFNESENYELSYGTHGPALTKSDDFYNLVDAEIGNLKIKIPRNHDAMLAQIFGERWRIPDPGFKHKSRTRHWDRRYHLTVPEVSSLYWKQFYRDNPIAGGSSFANFVAERLRPQSVIAELGCGSGRDSVYFAQHGHHVFASDRAVEAIAQGTSNSQELSTISFSRVDASRSEEVSGLLKKAFGSDVPATGDRVVYMRFFLHSVTKDIQDVIIDAMRATLPAGVKVALEFRTEKDAEEAHVFGGHYRRYIPLREMTETLQAAGFRVTHSEESRGLSPYMGEDPFLCRILAEKE